jgi:hypothetical protein
VGDGVIVGTPGVGEADEVSEAAVAVTGLRVIVGTGVSEGGTDSIARWHPAMELARMKRPTIAAVGRK